MNIFAISPCPKTCAAFSVDKHCVKMILETAQMLSANFKLLDCDSIQNDSGDHFDLVSSPKSVVQHPCTKWARSSRHAMLWLAELGAAYCETYTRRYDKIHKYNDFLIACVHVCNRMCGVSFSSFAEMSELNVKPWHTACGRFSFADGVKYTAREACIAYCQCILIEKRHLHVWNKNKSSSAITHYRRAIAKLMYGYLLDEVL